MDGFSEGMNKFARFVTDDNLMDADLKRIKYTWTNGRCRDAHI